MFDNHIKCWSNDKFIFQNIKLLDDDQLKNLLDEAISYKGPKDKENKSEIFKVRFTQFTTIWVNYKLPHFNIFILIIQ